MKTYVLQKILGVNYSTPMSLEDAMDEVIWNIPLRYYYYWFDEIGYIRMLSNNKKQVEQFIVHKLMNMEFGDLINLFGYSVECMEQKYDDKVEEAETAVVQRYRDSLNLSDNVPYMAELVKKASTPEEILEAIDFIYSSPSPRYEALMKLVEAKPNGQQMLRRFFDKLELERRT